MKSRSFLIQMAASLIVFVNISVMGSISLASNPVDETVSKTAVQLTQVEQVIDSLDGVDALYTVNANPNNDSVYSCAAFVKRYFYDTSRDVEIILPEGGMPTVDEGTVVRITSQPHVGDIVRFSYGHWALVKEVNGSNVTLIEQNWKWKDDQGTPFAAQDRVIRITDQVFYRWKSSVWGDMDSDGVVTIVDALIIAQYSVGITDHANNLEYADVNRDGLVDITDALLVAKYTVGNIPYLPWTGYMR